MYINNTKMCVKFTLLGDRKVHLNVKKAEINMHNYPISTNANLKSLISADDQYGTL